MEEKRVYFIPEHEEDNEDPRLKLIGERVTKLYTDEDNHVLVLESADKFIRLKPETLCCEIVYIYQISGIESLIGATISAIEKKELDEVEDNIRKLDCDDLCLIAFNYTIKTDKGHCDIEYRNEHNGAYPYVELNVEIFPNLNSCFYGDFKEITEDF